MSEEEAEKVRLQNEEIRKKREETAHETANRFACFKRDFMGAPIWRGLTALKNKTEPPKPSQIDYRKDERYWVFPEKDKVSVTFEINLENKEDQQLGRIFLLELNDIKRTIVNAPGITYHDLKFPDNVKTIFPGTQNKKTSNGSVSFVVGEVNLKNGIDNVLSQLIGFRQYMQFHLTALKI